MTHEIILYLFSSSRDVSVSFVACIIGGLVSVIMVYGWYGLAFQQSIKRNDTNITEDNVYHWISYVFMTFHEASVEGNKRSRSYRMSCSTRYMHPFGLYNDVQSYFLSNL